MYAKIIQIGRFSPFVDDPGDVFKATDCGPGGGKERVSQAPPIFSPLTSPVGRHFISPTNSHTTPIALAYNTMAASVVNGHTYESERIAHQEEKHLPGGWVVLKFGGTSVGKFAENIAAIVQ